MAPCPVITGIGLVSSLGQTADQTWEALLAGGGVADHARLSGLMGPDPDRGSAMAIQAAKEALASVGWTPSVCRDDDSALFLATSKGPIESWLASSGLEITGLASIATDVAGSLRFGAGARLTLSAACASGLHALIRAAMAIASGEAQRVLVVAVEASVHPLFVSSFKRLGVLAPEGYGCRPFDVDRHGFILSEAAAAVCLESSQAAVGQSIVAVDRFALGGDATHLIAADPQANSLRRLLNHVAAGRQFDLIHAHGTGTLLNDPLELAAIQSITQFSSPVLYSHKAALGHTLGAAGLVAVVLNCLAHSHGRVPSNPRSTHPLPMQTLQFAAQAISRSISRSMVIATGFGGPLAVVSLVS